MTVHFRGRAAAALAAGLICLTPVQASAAATRPADSPSRAVGTLSQWEPGIPGTVKRGQTIQYTLWYRENSPEPMEVWSFAAEMWNGSAPDGGAALTGISVSLLDPVTGKWRKPDFLDGGLRVFDLNDSRELLAAPNTFGHATVRITFGQNANLGTWRLRTYIEMDGLINKLGGLDGNYLNTTRPMVPVRLVR
ncbi:hypothetical protein GXW82_31900 [Streptacidiphilus sp. 4-A2]|nr:hypothetical protein [Streptacidiphilus sp. 4-A2]